MPILLMFQGLIAWLFRAVVVKFVVLGSIIAGVGFLVPIAIGIFFGCCVWVAQMATAFQGIPPSVWYFIDFTGLSQGLPLVLCAASTKFLIRRLPMIG